MRNVDKNLFCRKICFVAIYAFLLQNLFCRDLRFFAWSREPKIGSLEKNRQITGIEVWEKFPNNLVFFFEGFPKMFLLGFKDCWNLNMTFGNFGRNSS